MIPLRAAMVPLLRGMRGLAATVAVTALVPLVFLHGQEDWAGMGFPLVAEVSVAAALGVTVLLIIIGRETRRAI